MARSARPVSPAPSPLSEPWPGRATPLGAAYDGSGTNFSVFSEVAEGVELCLLDDEGTERGVTLDEVDAHQWHAYLPGVGPGQRYGYRVHGSWDPGRGLRCNPAKLLLDPYARAVEGEVHWHPACFGYDFDDPQVRNDEDSGPYVPRSAVHNPYFDWANDRPPDHPAARDGHLRGPCQRLHARPTRASPRPSGAPSPAWPTRPPSST